MMINVLNTPLHEVISRKRMFAIVQKRTDCQDAQSQLSLLLAQLRDEKFTGQLIFHFSSGNVCAVETIDNHKTNLTTP